MAAKTSVALKAQIDGNIKDNTSGTDFIEPVELNTDLDDMIDSHINIVDLAAQARYLDIDDARAALGVGKMFVYADGTLQGIAGVTALT